MGVGKGCGGGKGSMKMVQKRDKMGYKSKVSCNTFKKNLFLDIFYFRRTGTNRRRLIMSSFFKRLRVSFIFAVFVFCLIFSHCRGYHHNAKKYLFRANTDLQIS